MEVNLEGKTRTIRYRKGTGEGRHSWRLGDLGAECPAGPSQELTTGLFRERCSGGGSPEFARRTSIRFNRLLAEVVTRGGGG